MSPILPFPTRWPSPILDITIPRETLLISTVEDTYAHVVDGGNGLLVLGFAGPTPQAGPPSPSFTVTDDDGLSESTTSTVTVYLDPSRVAACHEDTDPAIDLWEILTAIDWWAQDTPVPCTNGLTLDLWDILTLIDMWAQDSVVKGSMGIVGEP